MPRYIDADALLQDMETACNRSQFGRATAKMCVKRATTADVVPVVRGEWTTNSDYPDTVICSLCGWRESVWWADKGTNYCPNCGAKMEDKL